MAVEFVLARVVRRELGEFEARVFTDVSGPKRVKARSTRSFDRERRARQVAHSEHVSVPERELELVRDVNKKTVAGRQLEVANSRRLGRISAP